MTLLEDEILVYWINICNQTNIVNNDVVINDVYQTIISMYDETGRYYHTLEHIKSMLQLSVQYQHCIKDMISLQLAIFFHDIVYNAKSGTNEDDSVVIFVNLLSNHLEKSIIDKVSRFIMSTKSHQLSDDNDDNDDDEKLFLDFDMDVLSWPREYYIKYAENIRREYIHLELDDYCKRRSTFLRNTINSASKIYHSQLYANNEQIARDNMEYECTFLERNLIPS
jgi:predicted metal-dependent HD superfamily phosphohydrolase